jgi:hypothetical protein
MELSECIKKTIFVFSMCTCETFLFSFRATQLHSEGNVAISVMPRTRPLRRREESLVRCEDSYTRHARLVCACNVTRFNTLLFFQLYYFLCAGSRGHRDALDYARLCLNTFALG